MQIARDGDPLAPHSLSPRELTALLAVERDGGPFLAYRDADGALQLFQLSEQETVMVGRRPEMGVALSWDPEVSGLHAELQCLSGEWTIVDDGLSRNGTFVEGQRVSGRQRLRPGDRVRVGRTILAFNTPKLSASEETVTAGDRGALPQLTDTQKRVLIALCRPYGSGASFAAPASNQRIAEEVFLSVDAVKTNLRTLFSRLELSELPQNQKRARLAEIALEFGLVSRRDLKS
jgi:pSer/pThr/pTyr-binding forkhead associated (FHA) protein